MAEDNGAGLFGVGFGAGVADAIRAQAAALAVEYDSLKEYKTMVDDLLKSLEESPADHGKLADGTLPKGTLGTGFAEADALFTSYNTVHTELQKLSRGLAGQIEALGIAILSAGKGYGDVDLETQRRMVLIAKQAQEQYVPDRDPYAKKPADATHAGEPGAQRGGEV
ncbi:hypothetical protein ACFWUW_17775 [Streptomyces sp. NPDC058655]|uniref:hypothetical protein n=1 Tax=unclassified Streptomyces TaxID=2593676 RepID=UPI0036565F13